MSAARLTMFFAKSLSMFIASNPCSLASFSVASPKQAIIRAIRVTLLSFFVCVNTQSLNGSFAFRPETISSRWHDSGLRNGAELSS